MRSSGDLEDNHQRSQTRNQTHDGSTGTETFRIKEYGAVHDYLAGQEVQEEKPEEILCTSWKYRPSGIFAQGQKWATVTAGGSSEGSQKPRRGPLPDEAGFC